MFRAHVRLTWKDHLDVLSAGDPVEGLLGYSPRDLVSGTVSLARLIHPADAFQIHELFSAPASNRRGEIHVRIRGADGRIRCLGFRYARARTPQGERLLTATLFSPGEPKQEPETRKCVADLLAVLDRVGPSACVKDGHHVICLANQGFRALFPDAARNPAGLTH